MNLSFFQKKKQHIVEKYNEWKENKVKFRKNISLPKMPKYEMKVYRNYRTWSSQLSPKKYLPVVKSKYFYVHLFWHNFLFDIKSPYVYTYLGIISNCLSIFCTFVYIKYWSNVIQTFSQTEFYYLSEYRTILYIASVFNYLNKMDIVVPVVFENKIIENYHAWSKISENTTDAQDFQKKYRWSPHDNVSKLFF